MKKTVQKAASLLLSLLFLLALVPTASAKPPCQHNYGYTIEPKTEVTSTYANGCTADTYNWKRCNNCKVLYERLEKIRSEVGPHPYQTFSADCDGHMQTLNQACSRCGHRNQATQICPASPHTGLCPALPLSVGPEVSVM